MCKKTQFEYCPSKIDPCMVNLLDKLKVKSRFVLACCCGHNKYPMTIVIREYVVMHKANKPWHGWVNKELLSDKIIPRKKKFYKRDKQGYYYIPETIEKRGKIK